jgi:uncharacterized protein YkwD
MRRHPAFALVAFLLIPAGAVGQSAQHDDVEIIDAPPFKATDAKKPDLGAVNQLIVDQTNAFREKEKRPRVTVNAKLTEAAQAFADYMAKTGRYGHTADGNRPAERAADKGYEYCIVTENIAYSFHSKGFTTDELTKQFVTGWQESPGHRKNMLDPDVTETGVAVARGEKTGYYFAVQMFGRPKSLAIKFQIANRSAATVQYKLGDKEFDLPPRYTRTHEQCRPGEVAFELAGKKKSFPVATGNRFVLTGEEGSVRVAKE